MAITEFVDIVEPDFGHVGGSHSLVSLPTLLTGSSGLPVTTTILPSLSTSTRATLQPAATTALTAVVRSRWRNLQGPRGTHSSPNAPRGGQRPRREANVRVTSVVSNSLLKAPECQPPGGSRRRCPRSINPSKWR